jgi:hypothetical protein
MRTIDTLLTDFNDICTLYRYLYMSEDHFIDVETPATTLRITMTEDLNFKCLNLRFPDLPPMGYNDMMTLNQSLGIIDQLKHKPGIMNFREGASRWDEIFDITNANLALNRDRNKRCFGV